VRRRGQIVIIATLVIAILILSVAAMLYESATSYQRIRHEYISGLLDNINREFDKVLTYILASITQKYDGNTEIDAFQGDVYLKFDYWIKFLLRAFSSYDIQMDFTYPVLDLSWNSSNAYSSISARLAINMTRLGFYGWNRTSVILLNATILSVSSNSYLEINLTVNKEYGIPNEKLSEQSFTILYFNGSQWNEADILEFYNYGGGKYTIDVSRDLAGKPLEIWIIDERGIVVELYYS